MVAVVAGWRAGWLVGWLAGLAGWLVGWLAGLGSLVSIYRERERERDGMIFISTGAYIHICI